MLELNIDNHKFVFNLEDADNEPDEIRDWINGTLDTFWGMTFGVVRKPDHYVIILGTLDDSEIYIHRTPENDQKMIQFAHDNIAELYKINGWQTDPE